MYYHGGKTKLKQEDIKVSNEHLYDQNNHGTQCGLGFYMTEDKAMAATYGVVTTLSFTSKTALDNKHHTMPKRLVMQLIESVGGQYDFGDPSDTAEITLLNRAYDNYVGYATSDVDLLNSLINATGDVEGVFSWLAEHDYTHSIDPENPATFVVYDLDGLEVK